MKFALLCALLLVLLAAPCLAQSSSPTKMKEASASGMAYGSILIALIIMIALPSVGLMLIAKVVGLGVEDIGIVRCVYTSLLFFAGAALVFYSGEGLAKGIENPLEFFRVTELLIRLGIVFVLAIILIKFLMSSTLVRAIIGSIFYLAAYYGCVLLSWVIIVQAGAQNLLKSGGG